MPRGHRSSTVASVSCSQADPPGRGLRRRVSRLARRALGETAAYEVVRRSSNAIELPFILCRLSTSSTQEHRQVARRLASALSRGKLQDARAIAKNARQRADTRAEKVVSHRYKFVWICNPKVASRSIIDALMAADPDAIRIEQKTLEEMFSTFPQARGFFSFAFVRDPCERARSFFDDKLDTGPQAPNWNVDRRFFGLRKGMSFAEYCRWLETPFGSDAFAERHWLSQCRHIDVDGHLPDYVGSYENLEENWQWVLARLGVPYTELPHLNKRRGRTVREFVDDDSLTILHILHRRYLGDFELLHRVGSRGLIRRDAPR